MFKDVSMLTLVIQGSFEKAYTTLIHAPFHIECFELRLDLLEDLPLEKLAILRKATSRKVLFTLRTHQQGGAFKKSFREYQAQVLLAAALYPDYLDLELGCNQELIDSIKKNYPSIHVVLSLHEFQPGASCDIAAKKLLSYRADSYKLALQGQSVCDAVLMLLLCKKMQEQNIQFTGIVMGEHGQITRILSQVFGNVFTFCSERPNSLGQLTVNELAHIHKSSSKTLLYGLIGDPVTASPSHVTHNQLFQDLSIDALYVKMQVSASELPRFLSLALNIFEGLSVTAPLKELAFHCAKELNEDSLAIGAINTLKRRDGVWLGCNTDYLGISQALETQVPLHHASCLILGAGGASKAIAYALKKAQAKHIAIANRSFNPKRCSTFQDMTLHTFADLKRTATNILPDLVIQATAAELHHHVLPDHVVDIATAATVVCETIIAPRETAFLKKAKEKGCLAIEGVEMFLYQAAYQMQYWEICSQPIEVIYAHLKKYYGDFKRLSVSRCSCAKTSFQNR